MPKKSFFISEEIKKYRKCPVLEYRSEPDVRFILATAGKQANSHHLNVFSSTLISGQYRRGIYGLNKIYRCNNIALGGTIPKLHKL